MTTFQVLTIGGLFTLGALAVAAGMYQLLWTIETLEAGITAAKGVAQ